LIAAAAACWRQAGLAQCDTQARRRTILAVPVVQEPELIAVDLRTYGEDDVADRIPTLSPDQLQRIYDRADFYLYSDEHARPSGASPYLAWAIAMAAVEVVDGHRRPLRWKRRKLKGIYPGC
jgi:hypothetical protein